jgi:hypothetical protein
VVYRNVVNVKSGTIVRLCTHHDPGGLGVSPLSAVRGDCYVSVRQQTDCHRRPPHTYCIYVDPWPEGSSCDVCSPSSTGRDSCVQYTEQGKELVVSEHFATCEGVCHSASTRWLDHAMPPMEFMIASRDQAAMIERSLGDADVSPLRCVEGLNS